jgi:NAD+ synthase (glutamine-hydrolysing)
MRVMIAQINPTVGDLEGNFQKILGFVKQGRSQKADLLLFPELALSGYPPDDFLLLPHFTEAIDHYLEKIVDASKDISVIVGTPKINAKGSHLKLCNSAAIIHNQTLIGLQDKSLLPTYDVFDELRYFEPATHNFVWNLCDRKVGITICEDIWQHHPMVREVVYQRDPIADLAAQSPDLLINLSASPFRMGRAHERIEVCREVALTLKCPVILCNQVGGNDSLIFDGYSLVVNAEGELIEHGKGFEEDCLLVDLNYPAEGISLHVDDTEDLRKALVLGIGDYFCKQGFIKACLGISGGIDSAVVAALAVEALGKENVLGILMPSRFSSESGIEDAKQLVLNLGMDHKTISIEEPFQCYLDLLEPHFEGKPHDTTEENLQSRIRGMILMAFSNKFGHIVLSTGNKSELAMGYATLYGDTVGGLAVLSDVTKMQVYALAELYNEECEAIPQRIIDRPPTAELREDQFDSDSLPDYDTIDTVVKAYVEEHMSPESIADKFDYPFELVQELVSKIHRSEYKRRQTAPGLRVSSRAFSIGRKFPIVQRFVP